MAVLCNCDVLCASMSGATTECPSRLAELRSRRVDGETIEDVYPQAYDHRERQSSSSRRRQVGMSMRSAKFRSVQYLMTAQSKQAARAVSIISPERCT